MEARKWENFNSDCLANIFGRLDLESLVLDIPFVCKQWYQALLSPLCWQKLVFPVNISRSRLADHALEWGGGSVNISLLIKFVVDRSQRSATILVLPDGTPRIYVSDVCPLKTLSLPDTIFDNSGDDVGELIVKWKSLEWLKLGSCPNVGQIIDKINLSCKNLVGLSNELEPIDDEEAFTILLSLATIKFFENEHLIMMILLGCKQLELLCVGNCEGCAEDKIMLGSRIIDLHCECSRTDIYDDEEDDDEEDFHCL